MIIDEDFLREHPLTRLSDILEYAAVDYKDAFEAVWGLSERVAPEDMDEDEWRELLRLYQLAQKFAVGAASLVRPPRLKDRDLSIAAWLEQEAAKHEELLREATATLKEQWPDEDWETILEPHLPGDPRAKEGVFRICLELQAHERFSIPPNAMAARMIRLLELMVKNPNEFVRAYLLRVAECYVRGMETELAVMARAVLELALLDDEIVPLLLMGLSRISSEEPTRRVLESKKLSALIKAAAAAGVLTGQAFVSADRIRVAGNAAAHGKLGDMEKITAAYDVDAILQDLAITITALQEQALGNES